MFCLEHVTWIVNDIFRTELVKQRKDALAFFEAPQEINEAVIPETVKAQVAAQVGAFFGFEPGAFSSLSQLVQQAGEAYAKNQFIYLSTSGSTGKPKQCLYTREMLELEGKSVGWHFRHAKRLVTLTPRQHLYGLSFAVLFSSLFDIPTEPLAPIPLQPWFSLLSAGDVVAGFPLFWEYFLKAGNRFPPGVVAVTSTAPCPKGLFAHLKQAGAGEVFELYGASETGGIGVRHEEEDPFQINDFWDIKEQDGEHFIHRKGIAGWLPFPDQVRFVPPRGIFPLKRMDRVVQVAGVNVSLEHIENVLRQHPAVKDCRVRLMRPEEGRRLKAFVVLKEESIASHAEIQKYLAKRLSSHEMPRAFTFGASLPKNTMGKDRDW